MINYKKKYKPILFLLIFFAFLFGSISYYYVNYKYDKIISTFYSQFNDNDFENAKLTLKNNSLITKMKNKSLDTDLKSYFLEFTTSLYENVKNGKILIEKAIPTFEEIKDYNLINKPINDLIFSLDETYIPTDSSSSIFLLEKGISEFNNNNFSESISILSKIKKEDSNEYEKSKTYIEKSINKYKENLINEADKLVANKYYTKAIELLSHPDNEIIKNVDDDIINKIASIESTKKDYLWYGESTDSEYTSSAILESISISNVNTLDIDSKTNFFVYVDLSKQKTYVYEGSINNWTLAREFSCSTGIEGRETPKGVYAVNGRDEWFFSEGYGQGGKYWVRFMGDYLFHSLPFEETATEIVDYTLGTPASHGCIRLTLEDSKWIYDNILDDTKVIIN